MLSVRCHEAMTLVIKPCALIPDSVHMHCTLVPEMLCHLSHGTDCPIWEVLRLPLRSYCLDNQISQFRFDIVIPATICALLGLIGQIDLLIRVTMFWNLPNRNFNTFIAQFTLTSHDENWEALFIDIHIDRERSDWANPTPGRSPMSDTLQHVRNQRLHPPAPREPHEETSDEETSPKKQIPQFHIIWQT